MSPDRPAYAFDPDLVALVESLEDSTITDLAAARLSMAALYADMVAQLDTTGLLIEDRLVPDAAPIRRCRCASTARPPSMPRWAACSPSTAAGS